jgi:hypothetical protein
MHFAATNLSFWTIVRLCCVLVVLVVANVPWEARAPIPPAEFSMQAAHTQLNLIDWDDFFPTSWIASEIYEFAHINLYIYLMVFTMCNEDRNFFSKVFT